MLRCGEAAGQQLRQGVGFIGAPCPAHVNTEIVPAKFPHHLTAHPAWREDAGNHPILAAHHRNGGKWGNLTGDLVIPYKYEKTG